MLKDVQTLSGIVFRATDTPQIRAAKLNAAFGFVMDGGAGNVGGGGVASWKSPRDFGAQPGQDATAAINNAFAFLRDPANARMYGLDLSGEWIVSDTLYACFPLNDADQPLVNIIPGRFVVPLGNPRIPVLLERAGPRQVWHGRLEISPVGSYAVPYANRPFAIGVRDRCVAFSRFGDAMVDGWTDAAVLNDSGDQPDSVISTDFTVDGLYYPNANNIGSQYGTIYSRYSGSTHASSAAYGVSTDIVAKVPGSNIGGLFNDTEVFQAVTVLYGNSDYQRTRLTVTSTAEMKTHDLIATRLELTPDIYGSVDSISATRQIVWTAGNMHDYFQVGDQYPAFAAGANYGGGSFTITSIDGPGRVCTVAEPILDLGGPVSHAAFGQYSRWDFRTIAKVEDDTHVIVYGWIPTAHNSKAYLVKGAVFETRGGDEASIYVEKVAGLVVPYGLWAHSLYGPAVDVMLVDFGMIGVRAGIPMGNTIGLTIESGHVEACAVPYFEQGAVSGTVNIQSSMQFDYIAKDGPRASLTQQFARGGQFGVGFFINGVYLESPRGQGSNEGHDFSVWRFSNEPGFNELAITSETETITLHFNHWRAANHAFCNRAKLTFGSDDGLAPSGALTVNLEPWLVNAGWVFIGDGYGTSLTITKPCCRVELEFEFITATKKVRVTRKQQRNTPKTNNATDYTFVFEDAWNTLINDNPAAITCKVPSNANVPFPIGTRLRWMTTNAGVVTLAKENNDVVLLGLNSDFSTPGAFATGVIEQIDADVWVNSGEMETSGVGGGYDVNKLLQGNGSTGSLTAWVGVTGAALSESGGFLTLTNTAFVGYADQQISGLTAGAVYRWDAKLTPYTGSAGVQITIGDAQGGVDIANDATPGDFRHGYFVCPADGEIWVRIYNYNAGGIGRFDDLQIRKVL